ncbi:MAG TPA: ABC transporter permease [Burkholderiaceae bacterium]|nr:ABC transporter permease [Burkholderiaceae bacterium]
MNPADASCLLEHGADGSVLALAGSWRLSRLAELDAALRALPAAAGGWRRPVVIDGSRLGEIDTAAALLLWRHLAQVGVPAQEIGLRSFGGAQTRIVELVRQRLPELQPAAPQQRRGALGQLGASSLRLAALLHGHLDFLGRVIVELARAAARPGILRGRELAAQLAQVCVSAIPVVALVSFLIGLVIAYLLGLQAEKYGANIFVVDGVALGLTREFSPLIVATIVAGRSGAAFTAQLGTMKLTEEIDAIRTLGLSAEQVLVVPRVLALVLSLPLLVFVGDLMGGLGAIVIAERMLDITPATFVDRLRDALAPRHFVIGLAKSPVFALFIAVIGCRMGLSVSRDTRSIGINTTSTVVQAIVAVILLDALFAVLLQELGL